MVQTNKTYKRRKKNKKAMENDAYEYIQSLTSENSRLKVKYINKYTKNNNAILIKLSEI